MASCLTTADWRNALTLCRGRRRTPASTALPWLWAWLVAAMFLAQSLGLMHNVLHTAAPQGIHSWAALPAGTHEDGASNWLAHLFPHHDNASDCSLYDQVSHGDGIPIAALLQLPAAQLTALTQEIQALAPAKPTIRVQARGPPSSR